MKRKILFFLFSLSGGGAERTVINIINNIDNEKYETLLILGTDKHEEYFKLLNNDIKVKILNCSKLRYCLWKLVKCIRYEKPDLLFSTINGNNILLLMAKILSFKKTPVIVREANNRTQSGSVTPVNKIMTRLFYNFISEKVIALSYGVKEDLVENFSIKEEKIRVIYNPIEVSKIRELSTKKITDLNKNENEKIIIAVGRLVEQKDFSTLIKAFNTLHKEINSRLIILGKGPKQEQLENQVINLGLEGRVNFLGFKSNPYKYMRYADVFILSSRWEGFGHVIVEAMATGTPVISTNCNSGPGEIIQDDQYGRLVPVGDHTYLAKTVINILKDDNIQKDLSLQGRSRAKDFEVKKVIQLYDQAFLSAMLNQ